MECVRCKHLIEKRVTGNVTEIVCADCYSTEVLGVPKDLLIGMFAHLVGDHATGECHLAKYIFERAASFKFPEPLTLRERIKKSQVRLKRKSRRR